MPSAHRRIAVPRDPELDRALRRAARLLPPEDRRSEARQVRALALAGAEALRQASPDDERDELDRVLDELGARRATRSVADLEPPLRLGDPEDELGSRTLAWARGKADDPL